MIDGNRGASKFLIKNIRSKKIDFPTPLYVIIWLRKNQNLKISLPMKIIGIKVKILLTLICLHVKLNCYERIEIFENMYLNPSGSKMNGNRILPIIEMVLIFSIAFSSPRLMSNQNSELFISSPKPGDVLKGIVAILGSVDVDGFVKYELAFSFDVDSSTTWFPINSSNQVVISGLLTEWDTNEITDGVYRLKLTIYLKDGTIKEEIINNINIQNYSLLLTTTPVPIATFENKIVVPTLTPEVTATDLENNSLILSTTKISYSLSVGIIAIIIVLIIFWVYNRLTIK